VLRANLRAVLTSQGTLRSYRAQRGFLPLVNAGDGTAIGAYVEDMPLLRLLAPMLTLG
jgi:hypothetical protein